MTTLPHGIDDISTSGNNSSGAILLLSDQEEVLRPLTSLLKEEGFEVTSCRSSGDALRYLQGHSAEVIIADLHLPDIGGTGFLEQSSTACPESVRMIVGAPVDKETALAALASGLAHQFVLKPWDNVALAALVREAMRVERELRGQQLAGLINSFSALPSSPAGLVGLHRMLARGDDSIKDLVREIEKSPPLVAKILHVANSVYYGARKPITALKDAVVLIGTGHIVSLAAAVEAFQGLHKGQDPQAGRQVDRLWGQALRRAVIARMIVERWPYSKEPQLPYVISLLQDIGQALRVCSEPEKYSRWMELCQGHAMPYQEADEKVFGIPHPRVGAALLRAWNFPAAIVEAVAAHHSPTGESVLMEILQIADVIESNDPHTPHDPAIDPLIRDWREKLHSQLLYQGLYREGSKGHIQPS